MNKIFNFDSRVLSAFDNNVENIKDFAKVARSGACRDYTEYSVEDTNTILRNGFDKILGINFKEADAKTRRQAWRANKHALYTVIEDTLVDRMVQGWGTEPFFMQFLEDKNIAVGDVNEFYVNDNSLLQVSKFAGNHHDIVRQKVAPGRSFRVETSWYAIKVYNDFELFQTGKIDFADAIDRMYKSIDNYRNAAVLDAFQNINTVLPTDLVLTTDASADAISDIVELAETVATASGYDVALVGSKVALNKLTKAVGYEVWSDKMKDEQNENGCLGNLEGYTLMPLPRVHIPGGFTSAINNNVVYVLPLDPEFKPIKRVNEGDVAFYEDGMDGMKKDMTIDAEIAYKEGIGVVVNQAYGYISIEG